MAAQLLGFSSARNTPRIFDDVNPETGSSGKALGEEDQENRSILNNISQFAHKTISPRGTVLEIEGPVSEKPPVGKKKTLVDVTNKKPVASKNAVIQRDGFISIFINGILFEGNRKNGDWVGKVTQTLPNGAKFYGELKKGAFVGKITNTLPDGTVIHGQLENGKMSGHCILEYLDGSKRMGTLQNGQWVGAITWMHTDGCVYTGIQSPTGEWVGKVKIKLPEGITLYGAMDKEGMLTGHVVETYPDGLKREGKCKNGELIGIIKQTTREGIVTTGVQLDGCWIGKTTVTHPDGTVLTGMSENGKWTGILIKKDPDGTIYSGSYQNGNWLGKVRVVYPDGGRFFGTFQNGKRDGSGIEILADGSSFRGCFKDNVREGLGTFKSPKGKSYTSIWRNGIDVPQEYEAYLEREEEKGESFDSLQMSSQVSKRPESRTGKIHSKRKKKSPKPKIEKESESRPSALDAESGIKNILPKKISKESPENADEVLRAKKAVEIHSRVPLYKEGRRVRRMETKNEAALRALSEKDDTERYDPKMTLDQILDDRSFHHYPGVRFLLSDKRDRDIYAKSTENGFELDVILYRNGKRIRGTLEIAVDPEKNEEYHKYLKNRRSLDDNQEVPENETLSNNLQDSKDGVEFADNSHEGGEWEHPTEFLYSISKRGIVTIEYPGEDYKIEILPKKKKLLKQNGC